MLHTDALKPPKTEYRWGEVNGILINQSVDFFIKGEIDSSYQYDGIKFSYDEFSKYSRENLRFMRFPSHYFVEQIDRTTVILVGTGEHLTSPFLETITSNNDIRNHILITLAGDYRSDFVTKEAYVRLGNIISTLISRYDIKGGLNSVIPLYEKMNKTSSRIIDDRFEIKPMTLFNINELKNFIYR